MEERDGLTEKEMIVKEGESDGSDRGKGGRELWDGVWRGGRRNAGGHEGRGFGDVRPLSSLLSGEKFPTKLHKTQSAVQHQKFLATSAR